MKSSRGFTITEVLIVLAVAGLIMGIVFYSVPQLSRGQRDTTRKNLDGRILSSIETYASNNQGVYPFNGVTSSWTNDCSQAPTGGLGQTCNDWYSNYVSGGKINLADPSCSTSAIYYTNSTGTPTYSTWSCTAGSNNVVPGSVYIGVGDICDSGALAAGQFTGSSTSKQFAVLTALDKPGIWYCVDNR